MKKIIFILALGLVGMLGSFSEAKTSYIPMLLFQTEQGEDFRAFQYGGAFIVNHQNDKDDTAINPAGFSAFVMYNQDFQKENVLWDEKLFHSLQLVGEYRTQKNDFLAIVRTAGEVPFGNLTGTKAALAYGRELLDNQKFSLSLGGGVFLTPMTIGEVTLPVVPLPIIRFACKTDYFNCKFDFLASPSFDFTLFPKERIRFTGNIYMPDFRSIRDVCGEVALRFYLFPEHEILNVMNIMVGAHNKQVEYGLKNEDRYENQYYGVFAGFDMAVFTVKTGYNFYGTQMIESEKVAEVGKGFYLSIQGGWMF